MYHVVQIIPKMHPTTTASQPTRSTIFKPKKLNFKHPCVQHEPKNQLLYHAQTPRLKYFNQAQIVSPRLKFKLSLSIFIDSGGILYWNVVAPVFHELDNVAVINLEFEFSSFF